MTPPEIVLIRHGVSVANERRIISNRDLPHDLTALGRQQALALGARLAAEPRPVCAVYASPVPRARQTAHLLGLALGADRVPLAHCPALAEIDCGVIEGRSDAAAWELHDAVQTAWAAGDLTARVDGGESLVDVRARFEPFLREVLERHRDDDGLVLLVSHSSILRNVLPLIVPGLEAGFARATPLPPGGTVHLVPDGDWLRCRQWAGVDVLD